MKRGTKRGNGYIDWTLIRLDSEHYVNSTTTILNAITIHDLGIVSHSSLVISVKLAENFNYFRRGVFFTMG